MDKKNKIYTAADFSNYHQGKMSPAEMHALEKAALEDPFLADALDGYAITQTTDNDLLALKKRLSASNHNSKVFSGSTFIYSTWFRIAALLIVILGIGYFYYDKYDGNETSLAKNKNAATDTLQIAEAKTEPLAPLTETTTLTEKNPITEKDEKNSKENIERPINNSGIDDEKQTITGKEITTAVVPPSENVRLESENRRLAPITKQQNDIQNYSRYYTQQGNVTDLKGGPLQNVTIKDKNTNNGTITDYNGKFTLKTADSNAFVSVGSVGYQSREVLLRNNKLQKITLEREDANLQEVVVVGMNSKRKKNEVATKRLNPYDLQGKVPGVDVKPQNAGESIVMAKGNKSTVTKSDTILNTAASFYEYIKNNKIPLFDENNKMIKGSVLLSFDIDKNGKPQNITVLRSNCALCNSQAVNLLKNGPNWLSNILQSQTVTIDF